MSGASCLNVESPAELNIVVRYRYRRAVTPGFSAGKRSLRYRMAPRLLIDDADCQLTHLR